MHYPYSEPSKLKEPLGMSGQKFEDVSFESGTGLCEDYSHGNQKLSTSVTVPGAHSIGSQYKTQHEQQ